MKKSIFNLFKSTDAVSTEFQLTEYFRRSGDIIM